MVDIVELGDGERVALPPPAIVGQSVSTNTEMTVEISLSTGGADTVVSTDFQFVATATVTDADGAGYTTRTRVDGIEVSDDSAGGARSGDLTLLTGVEYDRRFGAGGELVGTDVVDSDLLGDDVGAAAERFVGELTSSVIAFPGEPVGLGARWLVTQELVSGAVAVPVGYDFSLSEVGADWYRIELTFVSPLEAEIDGRAATGSISGFGGIVGSLINPLDTSLALTQVISATIGAGDDAIDFRAQVSVDQTTSPPPS